VATSSNTIQYKLGSDFVYGDGSGQPTGEFTALLNGSYRIYMRDSKNCFATVFAEVPVNNTYGSKFRMEYDDRNGNKTLITISKRGYVGAEAEICASGTPFEIELTGAGSQNKFEPLLSTSANINVLSEVDFEFIELYRTV